MTGNVIQPFFLFILKTPLDSTVTVDLMMIYEKNAYRIFTAIDDQTLMGFVMVIPYEDMVMVDYLAVSGKIRSRGTGSFLMQEICKYFSGKKVVLLIERPDETARNQEQRIARRRFYFKNGFTSSGIFTKGAGGDMEILNFGGQVSPDRYLALQKYALGSLFFRLSKIQIVK